MMYITMSNCVFSDSFFFSSGHVET